MRRPPSSRLIAALLLAALALAALLLSGCAYRTIEQRGVTVIGRTP